MNYTERKVHHEENDEDWNVFAVFTLAVVLFQTTASAHGYISKPASRVYLANKGINVGVGSAQYEPQSVEAPKGFPISGPADGSIAGEANIRC